MERNELLVLIQRFFKGRKRYVVNYQRSAADYLAVEHHCAQSIHKHWGHVCDIFMDYMSPSRIYLSYPGALERFATIDFAEPTSFEQLTKLLDDVIYRDCHVGKACIE